MIVDKNVTLMTSLPDRQTNGPTLERTLYGHCDSYTKLSYNVTKRLDKNETKKHSITFSILVLFMRTHTTFLN